MWRVALEASRQTRWLALCQTESVGRDGLPNRTTRGALPEDGKKLMRMSGRRNGGLASHDSDLRRWTPSLQPSHSRKCQTCTATRQSRGNSPSLLEKLRAR